MSGMIADEEISYSYKGFKTIKMNYKVRIQKNKDFQIIENNMPIIKGTRPKWYSNEILFFYQ
jgi:hypothetical protein